MTPYSLYNALQTSRFEHRRLGIAEIVVLSFLCLQIEPEIECSRAANQIAMSDKDLSVSLDLLEKAKLVQRRKPDNGKHYRWMSITAQGRSFVNKLCGMTSGKEQS